LKHESVWVRISNIFTHSKSLACRIISFIEVQFGAPCDNIRDGLNTKDTSQSKRYLLNQLERIYEEINSSSGNSSYKMGEEIDVFVDKVLSAVLKKNLHQLPTKQHKQKYRMIKRWTFKILS
jgi:hypothetical protein